MAGGGARAQRQCSRRPHPKTQRGSKASKVRKTALPVAALVGAGVARCPPLALQGRGALPCSSRTHSFAVGARPGSRSPRTPRRATRGSDEVGADDFETLYLRRTEQVLLERRFNRSRVQADEAQAFRVRQGMEADAAAVDHAKRVAGAVAVDCPGGAIFVGRARGGMGLDQPLYREEFGQADIALQRPVRPDTIFRIFSMTKPIVAASVLPLIEQGLVALSDPISLWLPEFEVSLMKVWQGGECVEAQRLIRVLDVLCHTSGLFYPASPNNGTPGIRDPALCKAFLEVGVRQAATPEEFSKRLARVPLCDEPGNSFTYSVGTALLARIAEVVSGMPYDRYLDEVLLRPLGMTDTGFFFTSPGQRERLANLYVRVPGASQHGMPAFEEAPRKIFTYTKGAALNADGGLFSTIDDYAKFVRFLLSDGRGIVRKEMIRSYVQDHLAASGLAIPESFLGFRAGFGLGTYVKHKRLCGWSGLANTHFCFDIRSGRYSILMAQVLPFSWDYQQLLTLPARTRLGWQNKKT